MRCDLTFFSLVVALVLIAGCSTRPPRSEGITPEEHQRAYEPTADNLVRLSEEVEIIGATSDAGRLYIEYTHGDEHRYAYSTIDAVQTVSVDADWLPVYHLTLIDKTQYPTKETVEFTLATVEQWQQFYIYLANRLAPKEPLQGVLLNSRDNEDLVYRNPDSSVTIHQATFDRPDNVSFNSIVRMEQMGDLLYEYLDDYLDEIGIESRYIIANTGETGPYARPFVGFDREERQTYFLTLEPFTFGSMPPSFLGRTGGNLTHFVRSHSLEFFNRPFTFVSRLFFLVTDFTGDTLRNLYLRQVSIPRLRDHPIPSLYKGLGMDLVEWERKLDRIVGDDRSSGKLDLFVGGDQFFPHFTRSLAKATSSIKLRTYIFDNDDFAVSFADFLKTRSKEIDVDVMVDGLGTSLAFAASAGTMPVDTESPPNMMSYLTNGSAIDVRVLNNPWLSGDHVKTTIIDGSTAFIGGMNIGREYRWEWHDMMVRATGPIARVIEYEFDKTWVHSKPLGDFRLAAMKLKNLEPQSTTANYPVRIVMTKPSSSQLLRTQLAAIRQAKKYIYIENAYFASTQIIYELARARLRGVDVRVIVSFEGNHGIMNLNNVVATNKLLEFGVRVFAYPGMSHVKVAVYDGWACLGSANFDNLSFRINKEMNLATSDPEFVGEVLDKIFERDFARSIEITEPLPETWTNRLADIVASKL